MLAEIHQDLIPFVNDGAGADIDFIPFSDRLEANWPAASEPAQYYEYAIDTAAGGTAFTGGWVNNSLNRSVTLRELHLSEGATYYFAVRARTLNGQYSAAAVSDGQAVDVTSPAARVEIVSGTRSKNGPLEVKLYVSEANALLGNPSLSFVTASGEVYPVALARLVSSTWTGSGYIESHFSTGTAVFQFAASDLAGNTGTEITSGGTFEIDTAFAGTDGGEVANSDGFGVAVPAGVLSGSFLISVSTVPALVTATADALSEDSLKLEETDLVREFSARNVSGEQIHSFPAPITITLSYPDADGDGTIDGTGIKENFAGIYYLDAALNSWTQVDGVRRDLAANTLAAEVNHFSLYSIRALNAAAFSSFRLKAYPNPCNFSKTTVLTISGIPADEPAPAVYIYNSAGELVRSLKRGDGIDPVTNFVTWNGRRKSGGRAASGLYIYLLKTQRYGVRKGKFFTIW
jgi:hypothetical protein